MTGFLHNIVSHLPFYHGFRNWWVNRNPEKDFALWEKTGRPCPPPHIVKQKVIKEYAEKYNLKILVETGTYYGDMVEAMKTSFDKVFSIELSEKLQKMAVKRFRNDQHIEIIQGDSAHQIGELVQRLDQPALFWLDGHYSAGITAKGEKVTPVYEELEAIFNATVKNHIILIDDARCFGVNEGYPSIAELTEFVQNKRPGSEISVDTDSVRIIPSV